ncbi:MAG: glutamine amidotransferase [Gammaproteobacteria bacterium]
MKRLFVFKLGSTWPDTARRLGDFDQWTARTLGTLDVPLEVIDAEHGMSLPGHARCAGVVMTGSHAMVTDDLPWSVKLESWLREALEQRVPILGVCYGHQLLARAAGGHVDYHPEGREIGTVEIRTMPASAADPLFAGVPESFRAHTTHAQSVLGLPPGAVHLAGNQYERNHAFRLGDCAWGVQFHPEYTTAIMREYIEGLAEQLRAAGVDVARLSEDVIDTPVARNILRRFGESVCQQNGGA